MTGLWSDFRFALRTLARSPLFTVVAILSLALGTGANTAVFTLLDQIMLRQLPIKDPDSLVMLFQEGVHNGSNMGHRMHSYPMYQDFQQKAEPFSEVLCRRLFSASLSVNGSTERARVELVSGNYFTMLGVKAAAGRVFDSQTDDQVFGGHPSVVLGYDYWASRFHRDPGVIGAKMLVNNHPMTIVGVSAAGFSGLDPAVAPQIRVPIQMQAALTTEWSWLKIADRRTRWVQVFARLKPGYTIESAQPPMQGLFTQLRQYETTLPEAKDWSKYVRDEFLKGKLKLEAADKGHSELRRSFSKALVVLMCMVGLVLLIACVNVANLLIARAVARQKEVSVRLAIGASRLQLVRQLMIESLVLAVAGSAAGVFLAIWITRSLLSLIPVEGSPLLIRSQPDMRLLLFSTAVALLTGLVFGLLPALRATRPDLWATLKDAVGSIAGSGGTVYLRKGLVTAQVILSFLLLFGAGLFVRSLQNLKGTQTGFHDMENLITFQVSPALNGYSAERVMQFYDTLLENLRSAPGVKSAGIATVQLLAGDEWDSSMSVEGHTPKDGEDMQAFMNSVAPGYFEAMGVPVLAGRDFDRRDIKPETRVAIVNQKFARHFFGDKNPIGRRLGWGGGPKTKLDIEIIGVTADSLYEGPREGVRRQVFIPKYGNSTAVVYVRSNQDSKLMFPALRDQVRKLDAAIPVYDMKTLEAQLDETLLTERLVALLSAGFGLLATLLAAVGLYGVMAYVVARRTKELGLRMALGAEASNVLWIVMREVLTLLGIGLLIALPLALALGRFVASQLYGMQANDPVIATGTVVLLASVAILAGLVPARRAARLDPMIALRYE